MYISSKKRGEEARQKISSSVFIFISDLCLSFLKELSPNVLKGGTSDYEEFIHTASY